MHPAVEVYERFPAVPNRRFQASTADHNRGGNTMAPQDEDSPNALLLAWVKEWYDTARERNSKGVTTYKHAYDALRKCPMPFDHPSQLQQLKGFGPKLCERLTVQLQKHCDENNLEMPEHPMASRKRKGVGRARATGAGAGDGDGSEDDDDDGPSAPPAKKPRKVKQYVPTYRSGAYALVIALSKEPEDAAIGMSKQDLIDAAQPYSDSSFTAPSDPGKFYTAWSSMKTLMTKELVYERGRPTKRYALTDEGWEVARKIEATTGNGRSQKKLEDDKNDVIILDEMQSPRPRQPTFSTRVGAISDDDDPPVEKPNYTDVVTDGPVLSADSSFPVFTPIVLKPGTFSVHLLLDVREVRAKTDRDYLKEELAKKGVRPIMRALELGDIQWVAKCHDPGFLRLNGAEGDEVVLDHIIERKRLDDLIGSIKDGRFREQKFRLKRSGVSHVTYLIEEISLDQSFFQKYEESVESAIASTQVVNGFSVKKTRGVDESIRYLARMTSMLKNLYESKPLKVIPTRIITAQNYLPFLSHLRAQEPRSDYYISYPAFASLASKSDMLTLRDLYLKMLMCTRGVTGEKAIEIQKIWKTPYDFVKAFENCGSSEDGKKKKRELVSTQLGNKVKSKQIGKALSTKIAEAWGGV
ncbi:Crossover junction endonuclease mus81 [Gnomoniopsis smithogilvyi]|uniref:Crossover junction endonuclease MUS81 n=1 Tax=Gnomoniopsis smithogilvyi TaxID=1191159 RepID=A0A9W9CYT3_9PEZI|nr:Crossover junction endonuclease mus81 [Gnomoniopsis smithogilvyi]